MKTTSLDRLKEKEHNLLDNTKDALGHIDPCTSVDKFMELNHGGMGEDSEEAALREKHTRKVLSERPLPSYQPYA